MDKNNKTVLYLNLILLLAGGLFMVSAIISEVVVLRMIYIFCGTTMLLSGVIAILKLKK